MSTPKKSSPLPQDWHPWDIKAALGKRGYSLRRVVIENGFSTGSAHEVLRKQWPNMERAVASILGMDPWEIWPSRYTADKQPLYCYGPRVSSGRRKKTSPAKQG